MAQRLRGRYGYPADQPFRVTPHPDKIWMPFGWKKPRRVFVNSMGDLFHADVPFEWVDAILAVIEANPQHTFMVLTKRPGRMGAFVRWWMKKEDRTDLPRNLWLGVTAENQQMADKRIQPLMEIPAELHFISVEPMLGPVVLSGFLMTYNGPRWIILGGETGPGARTMDPDWARAVRDKCIEANVPFFFKKMGGGDKSSILDGREWKQFP